MNTSPLPTRPFRALHFHLHRLLTVPMHAMDAQYADRPPLIAAVHPDAEEPVDLLSLPTLADAIAVVALERLEDSVDTLHCAVAAIAAGNYDGAALHLELAGLRQVKVMG